jgi:hypothetical protein
MHGIARDVGAKDILFALTLELVFLGFCAVFIGLGLSELKKKKDPLRNYLLIGLGVSLAAVSLYVTKLLIEG